MPQHLSLGPCPRGYLDHAWTAAYTPSDLTQISPNRSFCSALTWLLAIRSRMARRVKAWTRGSSRPKAASNDKEPLAARSLRTTEMRWATVTLARDRWLVSGCLRDISR